MRRGELHKTAPDRPWVKDKLLTLRQDLMLDMQLLELVAAVQPFDYRDRIVAQSTVGGRCPLHTQHTILALVRVIMIPSRLLLIG